MGYISKAIALCGKKQIRDAHRAFDLASTFTDPNTIHFLFLIKVGWMFLITYYPCLITVIRLWHSSMRIDMRTQYAAFES